ncbi:MAG TPA: hypothetical protein VGA03_05575, partial [Anaerolineales bacterium]
MKKALFSLMMVALLALAAYALLSPDGESLPQPSPVETPQGTEPVTATAPTTEPATAPIAGPATSAAYEGAGVSASAVAISPDGAWLAAVNPDSGSVSLVSLPGLELKREIQVGRDPRTLT